MDNLIGDTDRSLKMPSLGLDPVTVLPILTGTLAGGELGGRHA